MRTMRDASEFGGDILLYKVLFMVVMTAARLMCGYL
jgi:hypothetical protein